uniref:Uncharacterized protein n=1 Tax=Sphaerodactylus townsendi TaxID=933632 RepID=A0ACB8FMN3_9SAUR
MWRFPSVIMASSHWLMHLPWIYLKAGKEVCVDVLLQSLETSLFGSMFCMQNVQSLYLEACLYTEASFRRTLWEAEEIHDFSAILPMFACLIPEMECSLNIQKWITNILCVLTLHFWNSVYVCV